jgi:hypothetical protein
LTNCKFYATIYTLYHPNKSNSYKDNINTTKDKQSHAKKDSKHL